MATRISSLIFVPTRSIAGTYTRNKTTSPLRENWRADAHSVARENGSRITKRRRAAHDRARHPKPTPPPVIHGMFRRRNMACPTDEMCCALMCLAESTAARAVRKPSTRLIEEKIARPMGAPQMGPLYNLALVECATLAFWNADLAAAGR